MGKKEGRPHIDSKSRCLRTLLDRLLALSDGHAAVVPACARRDRL